MSTPSYTELDSNKPDGSTSPTQYAADDLANDRAIRDMAMGMLAKGFVQSRTTGTGPDASRPQYVTWLNAALSVGFRWKLTWGGTGNYQISTIEMEWTNDNGSSWTSVRTAQANTFDADDNITASAVSGGAWTMLLEVWGKIIKGRDLLATHLAAVGTAVHGLGTMSTQNANAIAVAGGAIDNTPIGQTTPEKVRALRVAEAFVNLGSIAAAGTATLDLSTGSDFAMTPNSTTSNTMTVAVSNPPPSGYSQAFMFEIVNGRRSADGKITWPASFHWIGGSGNRPLDTALELSGSNLFTAKTRDGGTTYDVQHLGKRG